MILNLRVMRTIGSSSLLSLVLQAIPSIAAPSADDSSEPVCSGLVDQQGLSGEQRNSDALPAAPACEYAPLPEGESERKQREAAFLQLAEEVWPEFLSMRARLLHKGIFVVLMLLCRMAQAAMLQPTRTQQQGALVTFLRHREVAMFQAPIAAAMLQGLRRHEEWVEAAVGLSLHLQAQRRDAAMAQHAHDNVVPRPVGKQPRSTGVPVPVCPTKLCSRVYVVLRLHQSCLQRVVRGR